MKQKIGTIKQIVAPSQVFGKANRLSGLRKHEQLRDTVLYGYAFDEGTDSDFYGRICVLDIHEYRGTKTIAILHSRRAVTGSVALSSPMIMSHRIILSIPMHRRHVL